MWPPNSPDLNPVDYAIWSVIQLDAVGNTTFLIFAVLVV